MSMNCISCVRMPRTGTDLLCDDCRAEENATAKLRSWAPAPKETPAPAAASVPIRTCRILDRVTGKAVHETPGQWTKPENKAEKAVRQYFVMSAYSATKYTRQEAIDTAQRFGLSNDTHKITNQ